MKSESSIAWRNLNQAIEAVAAARPADMTAAAANLLQARTSYEQSTAVLPDPPLDTSSMSIWDRIKVKLQNTQQRLNRWENTWKKALLRKTFGLAILILLFGYTLTVVFGFGGESELAGTLQIPTGSDDFYRCVPGRLVVHQLPAGSI
jgi:hypothetical protein